MKLWTGRMDGSYEGDFARLNNSLPFDQRLAQQDITGSLAWAKALAQAKLLSTTELESILNGLHAIQTEFEQGRFIFDAGDEDIHTAVERRLTELIGSDAGKLHTGRSRNDQVATDFRIWVRDAIVRVEQCVGALQLVLINRAEADMGVIMPGYTHMQQAQPVLLSHWWLSHFWALQRDRGRLHLAAEETGSMPLGSGALAGTPFPVDRFELAKELGFQEPSPNSLDSVSDRDFALSFLFCATTIGIHMSRFAETLILFSTLEFGFVVLADKYSTGSSLMPQKKNPDSLELIRAKSGYLTARLTGLLTLLKGLPSAYDKDLQEDKQPVFEAADTLEMILPVLGGVIETLTVKPERMLGAFNDQILATDLADYLVVKGVPFRDAHHAVGKVVGLTVSQGIKLKDMPLEDYQRINPAFDSDLYLVFDYVYSVSRRANWGGTAPQAVEQQITLAKERLSRF